MAEEIDAEIALVYTLKENDPEDIEMEFDPDAEDPPELIGPDGLDLGEAVVQQFAVLLNPYPRCKDAVLPSSVQAGTDDGAIKSPFAALKELKPLETQRQLHHGAVRRPTLAASSIIG